MDRKWYPYHNEIRPITMETLIYALELVSLENFDKHGAVVKVIKYHRSYFIQFEDGSFSTPIERISYCGNSIYVQELFDLGILKQKHLNEIKAEKETIEKAEAEERRQSHKEGIVSQARREKTNSLRNRLREVRQDVTLHFLKLKKKELAGLHTEACNLEAEIKRINKMSPEELLTPAELEEYNSL